MSRFANLELGTGGEQEPRAGFHDALRTKDEGWYLSRAQTAWEAGDFELALRQFGKAIECEVTHAAGWVGQVQMLIELGQLKEALLWADKALERFPDTPELLAAKGVALARNGDLDGGLAYSDSSFADPGENAYLWLARGDILLSRREARASYCFEKLRALVPQNWFWRWMIARVHAFHEQFALGLKWTLEALGLDAAHSVVWLQLAGCQQALGLGDAARESLAQARQLDPRHPDIELAMARWQPPTAWARLRGWWRRHTNS